MTTSTVSITLVGEGIEPKEYRFETPARCVIGRAQDCDIALRRLPEYAMVSRHHCVLDIDPPAVSVRDLGSRNGTFVNGEMIGQRMAAWPPEETHTEGGIPAVVLKDGDEIRVGDTILRVSIAENTPTEDPLAVAWTNPLFE